MITVSKCVRNCGLGAFHTQHTQHTQHTHTQHIQHKTHATHTHNTDATQTTHNTHTTQTQHVHMHTQQTRHTTHRHTRVFCFRWILQDLPVWNTSFNCSRQTWKIVPTTIKQLPVQCPSLFMERCFWWRSAHGIGPGICHVESAHCAVCFLCLELSYCSCWPETSKRWVRYFLYSGANISYPESWDVFILPHFESRKFVELQALVDDGSKVQGKFILTSPVEFDTGGWWLGASKGRVEFGGIFGHDLLTLPRDMLPVSFWTPTTTLQYFCW